MTFIPKPITALTPSETVPAHLKVASRQYNTIDVELDPEDKTLWCFMRPAGRPSFTPALLRDIRDLQRDARQLYAEHEAEAPFQYYVFASRTPGVFNLGGDLGLFSQWIRAGDLASLRLYGQTAVQAIFEAYCAFDLPVVTYALVQGDALGGGFESALPHDIIVAERSAKMGLPEVLFNLFPGMGAYSFLSRRLGAQAAEKLILSGKICTAEELHEMGIVDILAEDGQGEEAIRDHIERHARKHNAQQAVYRARRRINPVTLQELLEVVDIWAESALRLTESDLRKMARLTAAQDRRMNL